MEDNTLLVVNIFLMGLCLSAIVVIVILITQNSSLSEEMKKEILEIEKKCPECPNCEMKCPENKECPSCPKCPEIRKNGDCPQCPPCNKTCQQCQECPSVDDIVTGMFPGRNPKVKDGGRYFKVDAANTYDGLSTSSFYEKNYKFPQDKILKPDYPPMNDYNLGGEEQINNSIENENVNTSKSTALPVISSPTDQETDLDPDSESDSETDLDKNGSMGSVFDGSYQKILP